jgi:hypothetical protein
MKDFLQRGASGRLPRAGGAEEQERAAGPVRGRDHGGKRTAQGLPLRYILFLSSRREVLQGESMHKPPRKPAARSAAQARRAPAKAKKPSRKAAPKSAPKAPAQKVKTIRDSFNMPFEDYALIGELKKRALAAAREVKKSELLRAGLRLLAKAQDEVFKAAIAAVPAVKTGRPGKKHKG